MKQLSLIFMLILVIPVYGDGWEGGKAKIKSNAMLCDYFNIKIALSLEKAGDNESIQTLIDKGVCLKAPNDFFATVVNDASRYTDPDLAQIMIKGASIWGAMMDMDCCYK